MKDHRGNFDILTGIHNSAKFHHFITKYPLMNPEKLPSFSTEERIEQLLPNIK